MTGRGRPRKSESPDAGTKCAKRKTGPEEIKQAPLPRRPDEKQNETKKKQKPKKGEQTEEKPSLHSTGEENTTNHLTEKVDKQQKTATDSPKVPVRGTKPKTCAARTKAAQQRAEEIKMQPESPKGTTNVKTRGGKAKPADQVLEEMTEMQPETPKDTTKASVKTAKPKACGGKTKVHFAEEATETQPDSPKGTTKAKTRGGKVKSVEQFSQEMTEMQPETPKDTTKASVKTAKAKACGGKTKTQVQFAEETQPKTPEDTTKPSGKTTKAKICAGKAKSAEKSPEEPTKTQPETPEEETKDRLKGKATVDSILDMVLKKLTIKKEERANAAEVINEIIKNIIKHLKENTQCFKEVGEPLRTGSYYEKLKISSPDEFDVMLPMVVDRVKIEPFGDDGAFYSVVLKRDRNPLNKFQETGVLSASRMLEEFRNEVMKCVKGFKEWEVIRKKKGCPAVTLTTTVQSITISLDVVLCLMVKSSWPPFTKEGLQIEGWLGRKVKQEYKREPYYLVPKYEGRGTVENDGVLAKDVWRVSFSHIEKAIMKNHGSEKTCCEKDGAGCCRKPCLKLLKHLLHLLKEKDSSLDKFCSYHAKTTLLHACCSRTKDDNWRASNLSHCFQLLLEDFEHHLENGVLQNFFIPRQNLLSGPGKKHCKMLAEHIKEERQKGFPIFSQDL